MVDNIKFDRKYKLTIETREGNFVEIKLPLSIEFTCIRNNLATVNRLNIKIYNLSNKTRNAIYKDRYDLLVIRSIELKAGYEDDSPKIFKGKILQAYNYQRGIEHITEIDAYDGLDGQVNSVTKRTFFKGENLRSILKTVVQDVIGTEGNLIGDFDKILKRGKAVFGNSFEIIKKESGNNVFIDNEKIFILKDNEVIRGDLPIINTNTGLLDSPIRHESQINFRMLFEPRLTVGQRIELESNINSIVNGFYKVIGFVHSGMISATHGGNCETEVHLWLGTEPLKIIEE